MENTNRMDVFEFRFPRDDEGYTGEAIFKVTGCTLDPGKEDMSREEFNEAVLSGKTFSFDFDAKVAWALLEDLYEYFEDMDPEKLKLLTLKSLTK